MLIRVHRNVLTLMMPHLPRELPTPETSRDILSRPLQLLGRFRTHPPPTRHQHGYSTSLGAIPGPEHSCAVAAVCIGAKNQQRQMHKQTAIVGKSRQTGVTKHAQTSVGGGGYTHFGNSFIDWMKTGGQPTPQRTTDRRQMWCKVIKVFALQSDTNTPLVQGTSALPLRNYFG